MNFLSVCLDVQMDIELQTERPFTQFAKDDYKKQLEAKLYKLTEHLEQTQQKKSGGTKSKKLRDINSEIDKVKKELFSLDGFNSFIDNDLYPSFDLQLNNTGKSKSLLIKFQTINFFSSFFSLIESPQKSPRNNKYNKSSLQNKKSQQNGTNKSDLPVYPVFNFKDSRNNDKSANNSFNAITNNSTNKRKTESNNKTSTKNKKASLSNELNMKPITSYYQVLQNSNSDSFKIYRSKSDSSDSPTSDRNSSNSSSKSSSSNSSSSSSSSSSSLNNLNEDKDSSNELDEEDSFEEEGSRKKTKKSHHK